MKKACCLAVSLLTQCPTVLCASDGHTESWTPGLGSVVPFAVLLLCIAAMPLLFEHWWEHNRNKAIVVLLIVLPALYDVLGHAPALLPHAGIEYAQFLSLIASLFIIAGGIHLAGNLRATPEINAAILLGGFVIANVIGTTGAAMVLIYPLLRANQERQYKTHTVVFFIFSVCNMGGLLTPLGDPPLFLGYLRGVPFLWTAQNLWWIWVLAAVYLLSFYYLVDRFYYYPAETTMSIVADVRAQQPLSMMGIANIGLLAVVVGAVGLGVPTPYREMMLWASAVVSLLYSARTAIGKEARKRNEFTFVPIVEVATLFAGIFVTMIPALQLLQVRGQELGVSTPGQYFFYTGMFSSVLDNAPTYLVFLVLGMAEAAATDVAAFSQSHPVILAAISLGAVLMGANTYIGNAPNFMVLSIARGRGVKMPSFFGYMGWSAACLSPFYLLVWQLLRFV